jgi:YVTN family beta-propeller protein
VAPDGRKVYFTTGRGGTVGILDAHSYELSGVIKVGERPWGLEISPDGRHLFTANGPSNDVSVVDVATGKEVIRVPAGKSPWGITIVKTP